MEIFMCIISLLTGCGVFMLGMELMSKGLENICGGAFKKVLGKVVGNRFSGIGIGTGVTAIIQSSSATTVMVIGLINAGVLTLFQAASIIMGANIGTTITGIIASFSSIKVSKYLALLSFVGVALVMFFKNSRVKTIGNILTGLGVIFVGLDLMSKAFNNEDVLNFFMGLFEAIDFPLILILLGVALTGLIQSSSAVTGIVIIMAGQGAITLEASLFIVLGSNIGTCVTALLSSIGANNTAKRAALFHLLFNVIGTVIFTTFIWIFKTEVVNLFSLLDVTIEFKVAIFHVIFNVTTTILLVPFIKPLVNLTGILVKEKKDKKREGVLTSIDDRLLGHPLIATLQAKQEIIGMYSLAKNNYVNAFESLLNQTSKEIKNLESNEENIDYLNLEITKYLIGISNNIKDDASLSSDIGSYFHVLNDIERIGDLAMNISEVNQKLDREGLLLEEENKEELGKMNSLLEELFPLALDAFVNRSDTQFNHIDELKSEMDALGTKVEESHFSKVRNLESKMELTSSITTIINSLERVANHLVNIAYSVRNPVGDQM